jgi:hypothetical protein
LGPFFYGLSFNFPCLKIVFLFKTKAVWLLTFLLFEIHCSKLDLLTLNLIAMTIQKTTVQFKNTIYDVILEDGVVSYVDPKRPERVKSFNQLQGSKDDTIENARKLVLQMIEKRPTPLMTFSD